MFTKTFVVAVFERAVKTFCQGLAAILIAEGTGLLETDWVPRLSVAGMAALVSVLTSVASGVVGSAGPSLVGEKLDPV